MKLDGSGAIGTDDTTFPFVGQGAYVDLGYGYDVRWGANAALTPPKYTANFATSADPWFFAARGLTDVLGQTLAPGYAVYDTWSFHYENNGVNEDGDEVEPNAAGLPVWQLDDFDGQGQALIDEGTNGFDDWGHYPDGNFIRLGVDDVGERETAPPYDKPLRGVQVLVRSYESDSRAIRQVRVNQHFMAE
jgi:hypothetical protein